MEMLRSRVLAPVTKRVPPSDKSVHSDIYPVHIHPTYIYQYKSTFFFENITAVLEMCSWIIQGLFY